MLEFDVSVTIIDNMSDRFPLLMYLIGGSTFLDPLVFCTVKGGGSFVAERVFIIIIINIVHNSEVIPDINFRQSMDLLE